MNVNVRDILNFINAIRGLDEQGVVVVSGVIAAELKACKNEKRKTLVLVK